MCKSKSEPQGKLWTLGDYDVLVNWFINCDKCTILVGEADNG